MRSKAFYALLAGFVAGSFAGAAFGVFFALSLDVSQLFAGRYAVTSSPTRQATSEDAAVIAGVRKVSPSVVSIGVLKEVARNYGQVNVAPFDIFNFGFPFQITPTPVQPQPAQPKDASPKKQVVGGGTGFIISADGLILTNRHVVSDTAADFEVTTSDGQKHSAKVLARDVVLDLAVLKIEAADLPVVTLGDSDALQQGETVVAIGNALSEFQNTVTKGVVSGINRHVVAGDGFGGSEVIEEAIQTDAAINPGNSGGPLIDLSGRVVGVSTAVNREGQSIGFAIPINAAKTVIESVKAHGKIVRPWLGVRYVIVTPELAKERKLPNDYGALIAKGEQASEAAVVADSPAAQAGLKEGDVILTVDNVKIDSDRSLAGLIGRKQPGSPVNLKVSNDGQERTVTVILGELPEATK